MEGHLTLSKKEQTKLMILERVCKDEMQLTEAAQRLGISFRQATRVRDRYRDGGAAALVHRSRGVPSKRATDPQIRVRVVELYRTEYQDVGPTHMAELLQRRQGICINPETLRLVLIKEGGYAPVKPKRKHRSHRKRKERFGEMVQLDGSDHEWFDQRGPRCFLMVMVDDATGDTWAFFSEQETTEAAMEVLTQWINQHGIPGSLYVDRKGVYITDREPTQQEQLDGITPATQFGRSCSKLGIRIIAAHSPQAKGRVEKRNGDLQRLLVVELRLAGISTIEAANAFLPEFLARFNAKFRKEPVSDADFHRCVTAGVDLRSVFCWEEKRTVSQDWTIQYNTRLFQIKRKQVHLPNPRSEVIVQRWRDGSIHILFQGVSLAIVEIDVAQNRREKETLRQLEEAAKLAERAARTVVVHKPASDHPWRDANQPPASASVALPFSRRRDCRSDQQILTEIADRIIGSSIPETWLRKDCL